MLQAPGPRARHHPGGPDSNGLPSKCMLGQQMSGRCCTVAVETATIAAMALSPDNNVVPGCNGD